MAVALRHSGGDEFGLDQGLVDGLGGLADAVTHLRSLECAQDPEWQPGQAEMGVAPSCVLKGT
jgi:hypothetical protein